MTLSFSQQINGKPTYFIDRIWNGLQESNIYLPEPMTKYKLAHKEKFGKHWEELFPIFYKLHTIRKDPANRWKVGNDIHFVINNRSKSRFQFAPVIKCLSIQKILIHNTEGNRAVAIEDESLLPTISSKHTRNMVASRFLTEQEVKDLALNDGFDSVYDFWAYFSEPQFIGKIIHWTTLTY